MAINSPNSADNATNSEKQLSRRDLLRGGAAAGTGLVLARISGLFNGNNSQALASDTGVNTAEEDWGDADLLKDYREGRIDLVELDDSQAEIVESSIINGKNVVAAGAIGTAIMTESASAKKAALATAGIALSTGNGSSAYADETLTALEKRESVEEIPTVPPMSEGMLWNWIKLSTNPDIVEYRESKKEEIKAAIADKSLSSRAGVITAGLRVFLMEKYGKKPSDKELFTKRGMSPSALEEDLSLVGFDINGFGVKQTQQVPMTKEELAKRTAEQIAKKVTTRPFQNVYYLAFAKSNDDMKTKPPLEMIDSDVVGTNLNTKEAVEIATHGYRADQKLAETYNKLAMR